MVHSRVVVRIDAIPFRNGALNYSRHTNVLRIPFRIGVLHAGYRALGRDRVPLFIRLRLTLALVCMLVFQWIPTCILVLLVVAIGAITFPSGYIVTGVSLSAMILVFATLITVLCKAAFGLTPSLILLNNKGIFEALMASAVAPFPEYLQRLGLVLVIDTLSMIGSCLALVGALPTLPLIDLAFSRANTKQIRLPSKGHMVVIDSDRMPIGVSCI